MKIRCPQCKAIYEIDDSRIPNDGIYGRCPKCNERFFIKKTNIEVEGIQTKKSQGEPIAEKEPAPQRPETIIRKDSDTDSKKEPVKARKMNIAARIFSISIAIIMGLISGLLIYFGAAFVFFSPGTDGLSSWFVYITFLGGWIVSTYLMLRKANTISKVFSRGFLIGASEWFTMIPISMIFSGKAVVETASGKDAATTAGAVIGGGLFAFVGTGFSFMMMIICLFGVLISFLISREMKPEKS